MMTLTRKNEVVKVELPRYRNSDFKKKLVMVGRSKNFITFDPSKYLKLKVFKLFDFLN